MPDLLSIEVMPGATTTARLYRALPARVERRPSSALLILGHGAGADQTSPFMVSMASGLAARGIEVATFNFLYSERQKKLPDRADVLEATWRAVLSAFRPDRGGAQAFVAAGGRAAFARRATGPLFIGGKSMGGRIASQVASDPQVAHGLRGLILLGYPLHPPKKPTQLRSQHLPQIEAPMLFVQGARDPFGTEEELRPIVRRLDRAEVFVVPLGDHSFAVPKKSGLTQAAVFASIENEIVRFIGAHARRATARAPSSDPSGKPVRRRPSSPTSR